MRENFGSKVWKQGVAAVVGVTMALACVLIATRAEAIPAFARHYGVECATCHTVFPERNEFGEAFRRNGFIWPGEKQPPKTTEAPRTEGIGLSSIPASIPLSFLAEVDSTFNGENTSDGNTNRDLDFGNGTTFELFTGGNMKEKVGFWFEFGVEGADTEAHGWLQFKDPASVPVDVKIGILRPELSIMNKSAGINGYKYNNERINGADPRPRDRHPGVELSKTFMDGHLFASGGVLNNGNTNDSVDVYGHVDWRIMGTDLNGNAPEVSLTAEESFTDYLTLTISGWGITFNEDDTAGTAVVDGAFDQTRYGVDLDAIYKALQVRISGTMGTLEHTTGTTADQDLSSYHALIEYMLNQKVMLGALYNYIDIDEVSGGTVFPKQSWGLNASYLYFQNLKLEGAWLHDIADDGADADDDTFVARATLSF